MIVNHFRKDLRQAEKEYPQVANTIDAYETGKITFDDCLLLIYETYHNESAKAAIERR